jgi:hypothetical protein
MDVNSKSVPLLEIFVTQRCLQRTPSRSPASIIIHPHSAFHCRARAHIRKCSLARTTGTTLSLPLCLLRHPLSLSFCLPLPLSLALYCVPLPIRLSTYLVVAAVDVRRLRGVLGPWTLQTRRDLRAGGVNDHGERAQQARQLGGLDGDPARVCQAARRHAVAVDVEQSAQGILLGGVVKRRKALVHDAACSA